MNFEPTSFVTRASSRDVDFISPPSGKPDIISQKSSLWPFFAIASVAALLGAVAIHTGRERDGERRRWYRTPANHLLRLQNAFPNVYVMRYLHLDFGYTACV